MANEEHRFSGDEGSAPFSHEKNQRAFFFPHADEDEQKDPSLVQRPTAKPAGRAVAPGPGFSPAGFRCRALPELGGDTRDGLGAGARLPSGGAHPPHHRHQLMAQSIAAAASYHYPSDYSGSGKVTTLIQRSLPAAHCFVLVIGGKEICAWNQL